MKKAAVVVVVKSLEYQTEVKVLSEGNSSTRTIFYVSVYFRK